MYIEICQALKFNYFLIVECHFRVIIPIQHFKPTFFGNNNDCKASQGAL